jgi:uncharacterized membrane protein
VERFRKARGSNPWRLIFQAVLKGVLKLKYLYTIVYSPYYLFIYFFSGHTIEFLLGSLSYILSRCEYFEAICCVKIRDLVEEMTWADMGHGNLRNVDKTDIRWIIV